MPFASCPRCFRDVAFHAESPAVKCPTCGASVDKARDEYGESPEMAGGEVLDLPQRGKRRNGALQIEWLVCFIAIVGYSVLAITHVNSVNARFLNVSAFVALIAWTCGCAITIGMAFVVNKLLRR